MSCVVELLRPWGRPQAIALMLIAAGAAGCSSETTRFSDNPFGSKGGPGEVTGSVAPATAPAGRVETSPLPPPGAARPATVAAPYPQAQPVAAATGIAGGGRGMASYTPGSSSGSDVTGSVQAPHNPPEQWTWDGGTAVTVAQGDTVEAIAHRHSVPAAAVISANNLAPNAAIYPGQRLVIPRRQAAAGPAASAPEIGRAHV